MKTIPEDRYICKWCWHCKCNEEATETAVCLDIGDVVNVNDECCLAFDYDPDFMRY